jgi:hypothetical protein
MARLNVNLSDHKLKELKDLAEANNISMSTLVRTALSLAGIAIEETKKGNKIVIENKDDDKPIKEIALTF